MTCAWEVVEEGQLHVPPLPRLATGHSRILLRTADAQVTVSRHAMVSLSRGRKGTAIQCDDFKRWPVSFGACGLLLRGGAPAAKREEWTLILASLSLNAHTDYFFFTQVDLPLIKHGQEDVHGLLGQTAISVRSTGAPNTATREAANETSSADPAATRAEEQLQRQPGTTSLGGQGRSASGQTSAESVHVEVSHQGEGTILGHYSEYMVASLAEHQGFRFSRFTCAPRRAVQGNVAGGGTDKAGSERAEQDAIGRFGDNLNAAGVTRAGAGAGLDAHGSVGFRRSHLVTAPLNLVTR